MATYVLSFIKLLLTYFHDTIFNETSHFDAIESRKKGSPQIEQIYSATAWNLNLTLMLRQSYAMLNSDQPCGVSTKPTYGRDSSIVAPA
ncbi:hypothetical protein T265_12406 [Opisthorchis viverrini]|uniref:Uncharacterized protein n=1 Tax=Opisthorchis viverrini TaxID=6198 RepID=A0A074Z3R8_OPIVI|nr:hypothetical protein T265_12406 [Opisthorchis viverrini]KER17995.1 hypothetical protein T265_12406 [Opisthorchis viverrini]